MSNAVKEPSIFDYSSVSNWLEDLYAAKKNKNNGYSIRSFAKYLDISHTVLIRYFQKKTNLSKESISKIARKMEFSSIEGSYFEEISSGKPNHSILNQLRVKSKTESVKLPDISPMLDIKAIALLQLLKETKISLAEAAERFQLSIDEARSFEESFLKFGLVEKTMDGFYRSCKSRLLLSATQAQESLTKFYKDSFLAASDCFQNQNASERVLGTETFVFDPTDLNHAAEIVNECLDRLVELSHRSKKKTEVYHCSFAMFRLSEKERLKDETSV